MKQIWVLPELTGNEEKDKTGCGLLAEARNIADGVGGEVTALSFSPTAPDFSPVLARHGISNAYYFIHPVFENLPIEALAAVLAEKTRATNPWLILTGHTNLGKDLAPRLAGMLGTEAITGCVKWDFSSLVRPLFYRPVYGGQLWQEIVYHADTTMLITMDPEVLQAAPVNNPAKVKTTVFEPRLSPDIIKIQHLEFLPADFRTMDITDATTVVGAGMGAVSDDILPLVHELASLLEGSIGTTRPVVDGGRIGRERMIGQTGKVVSPDFYLALGVSGASHHVGGIQESGRIVAVNRDRQAPIFQSSDTGFVADLREVLPLLIEKIKKAKADGQII